MYVYIYIKMVFFSYFSRIHILGLCVSLQKDYLQNEVRIQCKSSDIATDIMIRVSLLQHILYIRSNVQ